MKYAMLSSQKQLLDTYRPLPPVLVNNLEEWFRVELTFTSNAIEGNTLTRRETALVVVKGLTVGGKSLIEHLEATNHAHALDWVKEQVSRQSNSLKEDDILKIHNVILKGINDENAGHYRSVPVRISGAAVVLPNPAKVPALMAEFQAWLGCKNDLHPVEYAAEAHYKLVTIHPFVDGNGRTARLLMNLILMMSGYPPAIIRKRDRLAYISALEKAQLGGSKEDYYALIRKAVGRSFDIYIKALRNEDADNVEDRELLKIGALAKAVGESNSTIRHWTKEGLISVAEITESGYQLYDHDMIQRIEKINALKQQRYSLREIKSML